jgi:hypothetical protein
MEKTSSINKRNAWVGAIINPATVEGNGSCRSRNMLQENTEVNNALRVE